VPDILMAAGAYRVDHLGRTDLLVMSRPFDTDLLHRPESRQVAILAV